MGRDVGAADAAADLVELAQPEDVGALDDERVGLRDVDARLDDRGRDEHVGVAREERVHPLLELALAHLPVRDEEPEPGAELAELLAHLVDRLDAVVEVERLAAAGVLSLERDPDQLLVVLPHARPDRASPFGRRLDDRDVAQAGERHVQRPRDRRRREREHVDLEPERAQQLLLGDTEALLLVEDDEAELLRDHVAREDAMGADEHVDLAGGEVGQHLLRLGRLPEPRHHLDVEREVAEALAERVPVLLGEDRRRAEHEHLPAVDGDGERGPDGDLRLAEADVAADEPVHRPRRLEILLDGLDRPRLVVGLAVGERRLEPLEPLVREVEAGALGPLALGVEREELAGELAHRLARAGLEVLPGLAAELGEGRRLRVGADVAGELAELLVRDVEPVLAAEREEEVVAGDAGDLLRLEAEQLADAVILVDDVVADAQVGERGERAAEAGVGARRPLAEDLRVGQEHEPELAPDEPAARRRDREADGRVTRERSAVGVDRALDLAQQPALPQRLAAVRERDDDAVAGADEAGELVLGLGEAAGRDRRPLRLELERLPARERVELGDALEPDRGEALLLPDGAYLVRLPDEVGGAVDRRDEIGRAPSRVLGPAAVVVLPAVGRRLEIDALAPPLRRGVDARLRRPRASARWVKGENARTCSISSPNSSTRSGSRPVDGKTSTMPPRTANWPRSSTRSTRS